SFVRLPRFIAISAARWTDFERRVGGNVVRMNVVGILQSSIVVDGPPGVSLKKAGDRHSRTAPF
ncbi:MAG: hypothetical protein VXZ53_07420, partial [Planctomycetota bacterium]|nr:hypothetical protein [Planctomycetota bacterium]